MRGARTRDQVTAARGQRSDNPFGVGAIATVFRFLRGYKSAKVRANGYNFLLKSVRSLGIPPGVNMATEAVQDQMCRSHRLRSGNKFGWSDEASIKGRPASRSAKIGKN